VSIRILKILECSNNNYTKKLALQYWSAMRMRILECIGISVVTASDRIEFISAYRQRRRNTSDDISKFRDDMFQLRSSRNIFFICRDLNARHSSWNCLRANQAGNAFFDCGGLFAVQYSPTHTRISLNRTQNPSTLDIFPPILHYLPIIC
jgi:hypothetical protein